MSILTNTAKISLDVHSIISAGMSPVGVLISIKKALNSVYGQNLKTDDKVSSEISIHISSIDGRSTEISVDESHYYTPANVSFTDSPVGTPTQMYYRNSGSHNNNYTAHHNSLTVHISHDICTSEWVECPVETISEADYYCMVVTDLGEWAYASHFVGQKIKEFDELEELEELISGQVPFYA